MGEAVDACKTLICEHGCVVGAERVEATTFSETGAGSWRVRTRRNAFPTFPHLYRSHVIKKEPRKTWLL